MKVGVATLILVAMLALFAGMQGPRTVLAAHQSAGHLVANQGAHSSVSGISQIQLGAILLPGINDLNTCPPHEYDPDRGCGCPEMQDPSDRDCDDVASSGSAPTTYTVPRGGRSFHVKVNTAIVLSGIGTRSTFGTVVAVGKVAAPSFRKYLTAFRLIASGPIPPLKLQIAHPMYLFHPNTGKWTGVRTVSTSGIFAVAMK